VSGDFVAAMEDVLTLFDQPYDPRYPTVCLDEKPVVLHADTRPTLPLAPGHPERRDYEYERGGTANLFMLVEPLAGWRHVEVSEHRTEQDYARCLQWLVDEAYPKAKCACVVQDTLNPHTAGALYETFPLAQARRILARLHGSWQKLGGDLTGDLRAWLSCAPRRRQGHLAAAGGGARSRTEHGQVHDSLALHDSRRPRQAARSLPRSQYPTGLTSGPFVTPLERMVARQAHQTVRLNKLLTKLVVQRVAVGQGYTEAVAAVLAICQDVLGATAQ
jgi:hypothetical protein